MLRALANYAYKNIYLYNVRPPFVQSLDRFDLHMNNDMKDNAH